jgi:hypothetical protein
MSRIQCKCGQILSNVESPNKIEYVIYNNMDWLSLISKEKLDPMLDIPSPSIDFWKCPNCQRIYIWKYGEDHPIKVYKIEEDNGGQW